MPSRRLKISEEENQKPLFFDSLYVINLPVNLSLLPLKLISIQMTKNTGNCRIKFKIPDLYKPVNVYLLLNGKRKDMFYQIHSGTYIFNIIIDKSEKLVEIFYTTGTAKSESVFSFFKG